MGQAWGAFTDDVYLLGLGTFFLNYVFFYLFLAVLGLCGCVDFSLVAESVGATL